MTTSFDLSFGTILVSAVVLAAFYVIVSWSAGSLVLRKSPTLEGPAASFVLGHAVLALLIQLIAVAGFLRWYVLLPLFAAIVWINLRYGLFPTFEWRAKGLVSEIRADLRSDVWVGVAGGSACSGCPVVPWNGCFGVLPGTTKADGCHGSVCAASGLSEAGFAVLPAIAEMPYAALYALGGDAVGLVASKLSIWPVFLAVLSLLWRMCQMRGTVGGCGLDVCCFWRDEHCHYVDCLGRKDRFGRLDVRLGSGSLDTRVWFPPSPDQRQFWLFGFMSACAVMAKLSYALILPFCLGIPMLCLWWKQRAMILRILVIAGLAACFTFALGWWVKNLFSFRRSLCADADAAGEHAQV